MAITYQAARTKAGEACRKISDAYAVTGKSFLAELEAAQALLTEAIELAKQEADRNAIRRQISVLGV